MDVEQKKRFIPVGTGHLGSMDIDVVGRDIQWLSAAYLWSCGKDAQEIEVFVAKVTQEVADGKVPKCCPLIATHARKPNNHGKSNHQA